MNDFREYSNYLEHYGVKGMHWGVRRYQNPDGSLTAEGRLKSRKQKTKEIKDLNKYYDLELKSIGVSDKVVNTLAAKVKNKKVKEMLNKKLQKNEKAKEAIEKVRKKEIETIKNTRIEELASIRMTQNSKRRLQKVFGAWAASSVIYMKLFDDPMTPKFWTAVAAINLAPRAKNFTSKEYRKRVAREAAPNNALERWKIYNELKRYN